MSKNNPNKIDNKWETIVASVKIIANSFKDNWWKIILFCLAIGIMITGFTCNWKDISVTKDPIYQRSDKK